MPLAARILWLKAAALVIWAFAVPIFLGIVWAPARAFLRLFLDLAIWPPLDGAQDLAGPEANMLLAIVAGLSVAIGWFSWTMATQVMPRDASLARRTVALAMGGWFAVDSLGSWLGGAGGNVLLNVGFALLFLVPALWPDPRRGAAPGAAKRA
ncbi:MAG: hypothetical protein ACU0CO_15775 [Shimia sp.]